MNRMVAAALMFLSGATFADCPMTETALSGTIVDRDSNPISGVTIEAGWDERASSGITARTISESTGEFKLPIQYNTYSGRGFGGGEKCEFKLDVVQLTVTKTGFGKATRRVHVDDFDKPLTIELR